MMCSFWTGLAWTAAVYFFGFWIGVTSRKPLTPADPPVPGRR